MPKLVKENTNARFMWHWCRYGSIHASTLMAWERKKKVEEIVGEKRDKMEGRKEKEKKHHRRLKVVKGVTTRIWGIWCEQMYSNKIDLMVKNYGLL